MRATITLCNLEVGGIDVRRLEVAVVFVFVARPQSRISALCAEIDSKRNRSGARHSYYALIEFARPRGNKAR